MDLNLNLSLRHQQLYLKMLHTDMYHDRRQEVNLERLQTSGLCRRDGIDAGCRRHRWRGAALSRSQCAGRRSARAWRCAAVLSVARSRPAVLWAGACRRGGAADLYISGRDAEVCTSCPPRSEPPPGDRPGAARWEAFRPAAGGPGGAAPWAPGGGLGGGEFATAALSVGASDACKKDSMLGLLGHSHAGNITEMVAGYG